MQARHHNIQRELERNPGNIALLEAIVNNVSRAGGWRGATSVLIKQYNFASGYKPRDEELKSYFDDRCCGEVEVMLDTINTTLNKYTK